MVITSYTAKYKVTIWIDNAEVLVRWGLKNCGQILKENMVLDYDLWMLMKMLQTKIKSKLYLGKVDSHIETKPYKQGVTSKGDKHSIQLNRQVDKWASHAREECEEALKGAETTKYFYKESHIMVQLRGHKLIYRNIKRWRMRIYQHTN